MSLRCFDLDDFLVDFDDSNNDKAFSSTTSNEALLLCRTDSSSSPRTDHSNQSSKFDEDETTSSLVLATNTTGGNKKRKRKSYYVRKYHFPKLLKRDIRWDIPKMVTNVLNSKNEEMVNSFFHRMCFPSCPYVDVAHKYPFEDFKPTAYDIDSLIGFLNIDLAVFPDMTYTMKHAEIVQNNNLPGSKIVLYYEMKGTKLFTNSYDRLGVHCHEPVVGSLEAAEKLKLMREEFKSIEEYQVSEVVHMDYSRDDHQPLPQPMLLQLCPRLSFVLNEQNFVYAIEYAITPGSSFSMTLLEAV